MSQHVKDKVWWSNVTNVAAKQQTREHWFTTTISNFDVISEKLA